MISVWLLLLVTKIWEQRKLKNLITEPLSYGLSVSSKEYDGIHKYLRITDIDEKSRKFNKDKLTSPDIKFNSSSKKYLLSNNDIVFARTGASTGKTYMYQKEDGIVYYAGFLIKASLSSNFDNNFIFQQTYRKRYYQRVKVISQRSGQPGINSKEYGNFDFLITQIEEQNKIGKLFKIFDNLLALYERKLKLLSQVKKYFLDNLFTEKEYPNLRFKGFTDAWEQRKLGDISEKRIEKNNSLSIDNILSNSAIYGIVKQNQYFDKTIANNIQNYYIVHTNDFIYNPRISNNAPFGPISRNKLAESGVMSPLYLVFYFSKKSLSDFFEIYFKSSKWHNFMYMHGNSGARSDRFAIKDNEFFKMRVKIPHNKSEIDKIYRLNILLNSLITLYESKKQNLNKIKNTLLNTMFI